MNIKAKLRVKITSGSISLQPSRTLISNTLWDIGFIILISIGWLLFHEKLGKGSDIFFQIIIISLFTHLLFNLLFQIYVCYIFDRHTHSVYRENLFWGKRRLMSFDEATIFTHYHSHGWHYSLGIKKQQFLKSYKISPDFSSGINSLKRSEEYEKEVLAPILELLDPETEDLTVE